MCGITGWVAFAGLPRDSDRVLASMTETLHARGPDGSGRWSDTRAALGHRRLAVIDPPGGAQPMTVETPDGGVSVVACGEIYNFRALREDLGGRGHRFVTASDTEVILRGYLEWADGLAERLDGMFAFAIWDGRCQTLTLVRDRLGVKPCYFSPLADGVIFASEPKAVLAHPAAGRQVDLDGLRRALGYILTVPGVAWRDVREVEPGTVVTATAAGVRTRRYWRLTTQEHRDDRRATVARVRALVEDSVTAQLVADVPLGVLLSGGLDSSTLTVLAARRAGRAVLPTYEVELAGYADHFVADAERSGPDAPFAAEMAARVASRHHRIVLDAAVVNATETRRAAVAAYDVPPGFGDRDRSMYLLFRAVRTTATVVLSGEAADELFGGYAWFHDPVVQATSGFPWVTACYPHYGPAPGALAPDLEAALDLPRYLDEQYAAAAAEVEHPDGATPLERRMRIAAHAHLTRSLRVLLDRMDRLSMAVGLEVRVPYCDHRLVEYVYNSSWSLKSFDSREKSLLRAAAADLLPASVLARVKSAYPSARDPYYLRALHGQAAELAGNAAHPAFAVVSRPWLAEVVRDHRRLGVARNRNTVEWILNLAAWLELARPELVLS